MKFDHPDQFRQHPFKNITLLGMSGVGKTHLSNQLAKENWYHYSCDYQIGTGSLKPQIEASIQQKICQEESLQPIFADGSIRVHAHITIDNLSALSNYVGRLGNPHLGGINYHEFLRRQRLHYQAEIEAVEQSIPASEQAQKDQYFGFLNDATGSLCEIVDSGIFDRLAPHSLILHIRSTEQDREQLIERAYRYPKPLYFNEDFLKKQLALYLEENDLAYVALINPDQFSQWIFPRLVIHRSNIYEYLGHTYGYAVNAQDVRDIRDSQDFLDLITHTIAQ